MNWKFENTGPHSGVFNMNHDVALAQALVQGTGDATIRVYEWNPPAISLGWNQSIDEINQVKAAAEQIDIVRRPTGGRAILHSDEVTYSVVMRVKGKNVLTVYDEISRALVEGLTAFGIPVGIEKTQPHFPSLYRTHSAVACFSSTGRYEIKCFGKKLVGSAQRRYATEDGEEVVLQHGSILLGSDHTRMVDFLNFQTEEQRESVRQELHEKTIDLYTIMNRKVYFSEIAEALLLGFQKAWSIAPKVVHWMDKKEEVLL